MQVDSWQPAFSSNGSTHLTPALLHPYLTYTAADAAHAWVACMRSPPQHSLSTRLQHADPSLRMPQLPTHASTALGQQASI